MDELFILIVSQSVAVLIALINSNKRTTKEERAKIIEETKRLKLKNRLLELEIKEKEARHQK